MVRQVFRLREGRAASSSATALNRLGLNGSLRLLSSERHTTFVVARLLTDIDESYYVIQDGEEGVVFFAQERII
ncbi:hypothetical protein E2C01_064807 [Portunus trituberculatus]|uniref:Uncharacterized protein n=1 Tax=Portunus trituberculatus TaxID=210409 RepID=A0A5B7HLU4_PORTR|nr:hypothetical protein [Portunus trituberculatus]